MLARVARSAAHQAFARATTRPPRAHTERVLLIQPDHLGDILLSEPAVRYLREQLPDTGLIAVVGPWSAEITRMTWAVDRVVTVDYPGFARAARRPRRSDPYVQLRRDIERIRQFGADDAVILRDDAWWAAWLAYAATGRHVVTSDDSRTAAFATVTAQTDGSNHRTAIAMKLAHTYLACRDDLQPLPLDWDMSPRLLEDWSDDAPLRAPLLADAKDEPLVVIHPGSGAPVKAWPARSWRMVVRGLIDARVVLTGSESEMKLCDEIAQGMEHASVLAGRTTLHELAELLARADVAVGTDNGPMHLAGALRTPTIRLFGPSNPRRYGPWPGDEGQIALTAGWSCPRCEDLSIERQTGCGCMAVIRPRQVLDQIRKVLADGA